ncbi:MAG: NADPH:quinone reductase [SAR202 cluster bacterium Io17-Chloro-G9]|nr:MAG: NADPH:quinone reductase [SAR202 cluster bacterium Io17-Chloro-G9]
MKGVQIHQTGAPDVLLYEDIADPKPRPGEALVDIKAVGVNFTDVASRRGSNPPAGFPWVPGREAAGVVTRVGEGVTEVSVGDRVAYAMHTGSYAQQSAVPAWLLVQLPENADFVTGAATMLQGMTAHFLVFGITQLNAGDRVLVHAGAGGMGLMLIQMLRKIGAHIFTTVSTGAKAQMAKEAGADEIINYTEQDFEEEIKKSTGGEGVRMIYDAVGQTTFTKGLNCLGRRGYMALYGAASGAIGPIEPSALAGGSRFLTRPSLGDYTATRGELLQRANDVLGWVTSGEVKLHVSLTLPLADAAEAHRQMEGRQTTGKIILMP